MIFDDTCRGGGAPIGLTHSWIAGALLYRGLGRLDAHVGARSWDEALAWLCDKEPDREIAEIQYWGHGRWGEARIDREVLDEQALVPGHRLFPYLETIRARLQGPESLVWFRTCETFGAVRGKAFARKLSRFLGCRVAGHTHIIGPLQSGRHCLGPEDEPSWPDDEGVEEGTADAPRKARWSKPGAPNTITCFHGAIPRAFGPAR